MNENTLRVGDVVRISSLGDAMLEAWTPWSVRKIVGRDVFLGEALITHDFSRLTLVRRPLRIGDTLRSIDGSATFMVCAFDLRAGRPALYADRGWCHLDGAIPIAVDRIPASAVFPGRGEMISEATLDNTEIPADRILAMAGPDAVRGCATSPKAVELKEDPTNFATMSIKKLDPSHDCVTYDFGDLGKVSIAGEALAAMGRGAVKGLDVMAHEVQALLDARLKPWTVETMTLRLWDTDPEVIKFLSTKAEITNEGDPAEMVARTHRCRLIAQERREPKGSWERAEKLAEIVCAVNERLK